LATQTRIWKRERKYVGRLESMLLINIDRPPLDKQSLFYLANLISNFSIIVSQINLALKGAMRVMPKYFKGKDETQQPK
jgi:hypothetical protein